MKKQLRLGAFLITAGHHAGAWRSPGANLGLSFEEYLELARIAEAAKLDMIFFADTPAMRMDNPRTAGRSPLHANFQHPFEPITLISALAVLTKHIGLVATGSTTYMEPYNLARLFAGVDFLSQGRAGWNIVTTADPISARNFGLDEVPPHDDRYVRAEEYVDVVCKLWDSWPDEAFIRDRESGRFFDPSQMRFRPHAGKHFKVGGPLNHPRPPQGYPLLVQAGASGVGRELAGRVADVVFAATPTVEDAVAFARDIKSAAARHGRDPDEVLVMPGVSPIVGATEAEALEKRERLNAAIDTDLALNAIQGFMPDVDLSRIPLDEPLRDLPQTQAQQSRRQVVLDMARRDNLTLRQVGQRMAGGRGHASICGTAAQIADKMQEYFEAGGADGFNVMAPQYPDMFREFCEQVVPELQRRGLFRKEYEGRTLRENLGLRRPEPGERLLAARDVEPA